MPRALLVIDLEATCWEVSDPNRIDSEIIEIGLVILSCELSELWRGGWFVRPKVAPQLSEFCKRLTTITQAQVDGAPSFVQAMDELRGKVEEVTGAPLEQAQFISWGNYDKKQFEHDCDLHDYPYPFGPHRNLKQEFIGRYGLKKAGMNAALQLLKLPLLGTHHRGVDDAVNISRILQKLESE